MAMLGSRGLPADDLDIRSYGTSSGRTGSLLLDLPSEVRLAVYREVFRNFHVAWSFARSASFSWGRMSLSIEHYRFGENEQDMIDDRSPLAIVQTCRQCREESMPVLRDMAVHVSTYALVDNFPASHILFDSSTIKCLLLQQSKSTEWNMLDALDSLPIKFPNLSTLRVELPYIHAASLRSIRDYLDVEETLADPRLRQRLIQLLEQRDTVHIFKGNDYVVGDEMRGMLRANANHWRPQAFLEGIMGLPMQKADGGSETSVPERSGGMVVAPLHYRINVVTGAKTLSTSDGQHFDLDDFDESTSGAKDSWMA